MSLAICLGTVPAMGSIGVFREAWVYSETHFIRGDLDWGVRGNRKESAIWSGTVNLKSKLRLMMEVSGRKNIINASGDHWSSRSVLFPTLPSIKIGSVHYENLIKW